MRLHLFVVISALLVGGASCVIKSADPDDPSSSSPPPPPDERDETRVASSRAGPDAPPPPPERDETRVPATRRPAQPQPPREPPRENDEPRDETRVPATRNPNTRQPAGDQPRRNTRVPSTRVKRTPFSIEPTAGPVGTTVTIFGDFRLAKRPADLSVSFAGARRAVRPRTVARDSITAVVPRRAKTGDVKVNFRRRVLWTGEFSVTERDDDIFVPTEGGKGLVGSVYKLPPKTQKLPDFSKLGKPFATIVVPSIKVKPRNFKAGFPGLGSGKDKLLEWFAIRFEGMLIVPRTGTYEFQLNSDDGTKLYVDGKQLISNDGIHAPRKKASGKVKLAKGTYPIVVEYYQGPRYQIACELRWKQPGQRRWKLIKPKFFTR